MNPWLAVGVTCAVVALAAALGVVWRARNGRGRSGAAQSFVPGSLPGLDALAPGATLVQFSTEYCASCPATRRHLGRIARERGGVEHLDVDLTSRPELASALRILQTPTVFVLDGAGRLVRRFGGAPRREELTAVLDELVPLPEWSL